MSRKISDFFHFLLDKNLINVKFIVQSESVTLSVDYLISSTQAGNLLLGFFYSPKSRFLFYKQDQFCSKNQHEKVFFSIDIPQPYLL
jgi:hypothetical protein